MRRWWWVAWTVACIGIGILAGTLRLANWQHGTEAGGMVLAAAVFLLALGWWREVRRNRQIANAAKRRLKIVAIGGGTGLSVVLRGLKEFQVDLTAVVTVADDGGSSGRLRSDFSMPPPGDIRNCLVALADTEPLLERLLQFRFESGEGLAGHSFGNLFLAAMTHIMGDFESAIRETSRVLAVRGRVLPAVKEDVKLQAILADGRVVEGESKIPEAGSQIKKIQLVPEDLKPLPEVLQAIQEADGIVIGPGSLYTSVLPNLLIPGMVEAIQSSKALKLYICNVMTQPGETDELSASSHVETIYHHTKPGLFDYVLVNSANFPEEALHQYREQNSFPVQPDIERLHQLRVRVIARNFVHYATYARHDSRLIAEQIMSLLGYERESAGEW
ncbi:gluconeogenesis factor YvcK family protein [Alicyclobacillus tolerans]|uniref:gluconeogenesis factor YvcK family protein n=1 Tax=Alicyclobacillus tolerans TaxID=90970 RepID=UPI003B7F42DC